MRVASKDLVCGLSAKDARSLMRDLRRLDLYGIERDELVARLGAHVVDAFVSDGFLETSPTEPNRLVTTIKGNALANASFGPPASRAKAQLELDAFLRRVDQVNSSFELMYRVHHVDLFGSFLDPAIDPVGDIDLCVGLEPKWAAGDDIDAWRHERVEASAPRSVSGLDQIFWPEREVMQILKNRKALLSFAPDRHPQELGAPWRRIYEFDPDG